MSLMSYTYASITLGEEITLVITMPEKSNGESLPFAAAVLIPDAAMESSHFMREEPLERYGRGQAPLATVSLPGRVTTHPIQALQAFLVHELPFLLGQFPLQISAFYIQDRLNPRLREIEGVLKDGYPGLRLNTANQTLCGFLDALKQREPE